MRDNKTVTIEEKIADFRQQHPRAQVAQAPRCEKCDGSGFHYGPHTDWEKVYCDCPRGRRLAREQREFNERVQAEIQAARQHLFRVRFAAAGIQEKHRSLTVDDLPPELRAGKESAIYAVEHLRRCRGVPTGDGGVFTSAVFHGPVGTGKSAMLAEIAASWIEAGRTAMIIQWDWMIAAIQDTYGNSGDSWLAMLEDIVKANVVLIDDLGDPDNTDRTGNVQPLSPDQRSKLYMIVDRRYGAGDKPVVLATNFTRQDFLWLVGSRIYNRLEEIALFVPVNGANLRDSHARAGLSRPVAT
jgi:DNA replication protein DnaC